MKRSALSLAGGLAILGCSGGARDDARPLAHTPASSATARTMDKNAFVDLALSVPPGFTLKDDTRDDVPSPIPGAPPQAEYFRSYTGPGGEGLYLFAWDGIPTRDRGPMKAVETWKIRVDTQEASVSRTSHFFGRAQEVLVAHFEGPKPAERRYMIYTTRPDRAAFEAFLSGLRFSPAGR